MTEFNLNGKWNLILDKEKKGIQNKYFECGTWEDFIELPGTISEQKKGIENHEKNEGFLTDPYKFEGFVWFEKKISIQNYDCTKDYFLIMERTRISSVWIDGTFVGTFDSLCSSHKYNISKFAKESFKLTIMISNVDYPTKGGHMTSPDTQTNWIGITGKFCILEESKIKLSNIQLRANFKDSAEKELIINATLEGSDKEQVLFETQDLFSQEKTLEKGENSIIIKLPKNTILWDEFNPHLYQLKIQIKNQEENQTVLNYGIRNFATKNNHFEINNQRIFLRGKHDGMIFPKTGYAPTDVESWLKVMKTAKEYGINHYRFHTCCPPKAAFEAADILGIYMEPELPFWGTIQGKDEEGFNEAEQNYLISEGFRILEEFGNHPSFCMMSLGNELWGNQDRLEEILANYKAYDSRHLYTSGSNNFQFWPRTSPSEDFFVGVRFDKDSLFRGSYAQCDAPLGFVQTKEPNTTHDYDKFWNNEDSNSSDNATEQEIEIQYGTGVKKVKTNAAASHFLPEKPVLSHEIGQYCMFPDFSEIQKYTGVLKPRNYEVFKERLTAKGMINQAQNFFRDSSRLAVQCYKMELEAAFRSKELSGFQILDLQDFTGQGTAVVGVLDSFMESKGIVTGNQWKSFCDDAVILAKLNKFVYENKENLNCQIIVSNYSNESFKDGILWAYLIDGETDEIIEEDSFVIPSDDKEPVFVGNFNYTFKNINQYKKYNLVLYLNTKTNREIFNNYIIHCYPSKDEEIANVLEILKSQEQIEYKGIIITKNSLIAKEANKNGKKVLLIPDSIDDDLPGFEKNQKVQTVEGTYCTDFWCYPMFRSISESMNKKVPVGTLGLTIDNKNSIFNDFPTDTFTTPKWYNIISNSTCVNVENTNIKPIIQMIDNFERNWKLALVYKEENILVCTSNLQNCAEKPEVISFAKSLINSLL